MVAMFGMAVRHFGRDVRGMVLMAGRGFMMVHGLMTQCSMLVRRFCLWSNQYIDVVLMVRGGVEGFSFGPASMMDVSGVMMGLRSLSRGMAGCMVG
jgi:hypothetical protein